jgi:hypothetical protein
LALGLHYESLDSPKLSHRFGHRPADPFLKAKGSDVKNQRPTPESKRASAWASFMLLASLIVLPALLPLQSVAQSNEASSDSEASQSTEIDIPATHVHLSEDEAEKKKLEQKAAKGELHQEEHQHLLGFIPYFNTVNTEKWQAGFAGAVIDAMLIFNSGSGVKDIPIGLGAGKVWNFADGKTINFYMEHQYSVWRSGLGAPTWQLFTGINFQSPVHFQFWSGQTRH